MIEYKGYVIEFGVYGGDDITVQYCGDDISFPTELEAKEFIDGITTN